MENKDMENKRLCLGCMEKYDGGQDICPFCGYDNKTRPAEAIHLTPGTVLQNKYIVGKAMGYGGFSVTYLGYDTTLQIKIAIKEYLPSEHSTRVPKETTVTISNMESRDKFLEGINKFVQEAQRIAGLDHAKGIERSYIECRGHCVRICLQHIFPTVICSCNCVVDQQIQMICGGCDLTDPFTHRLCVSDIHVYDCQSFRILFAQFLQRS